MLKYTKTFVSSFYICNLVTINQPPQAEKIHSFRKDSDMKETKNFYCVILAGGKGRRLWPCSRESYPKQFIDFFGSGKTQLQQTFERFEKIVPRENIFINTNIEYRDLVTEQLPQVDADHIMADPIHRNTAPSAAWAAHRIMHLNPEASIIFSPSDQTVQNDEAFARNIVEGLCFAAAHNCIVAMGVKPTRPEPGYGYIQIGDATDVDDVYRVKSFTEKPEREFAKLFMESGEFYWNTGLFLGNARCCYESFGKLLPTVLRHFDEQPGDFSIEKENAYIAENFPSYPNLSLDSGVLERSDNVYVMKCDFGWADMGTWHSLYEAKCKGKGDNVTVDSDVIFDDAHDNVVKIPKGKLAVINGLDGYIVAEKDNVLLICRKEDSSALLRKFVNEVQIKKGEEYV